MRNRPFSPWLMLGFLLALPGLALSQSAQQHLTLMIAGRPGLATVVQVDGRSYIEVEALASLSSGSLAFKGSQIILTLPGSAVVALPAASAAAVPANQGFSKEFLRAAIEEMTGIREWRSVLTHAVQHNYPVTEDWINIYRARAAKSLTLTSVAASTDADRDAQKLLANELDNMQKLSNKIMDLHTSMDYIPPDTLENDPLDQRILSCAQAMASMAVGGQFQDDGSCH
jgi:hypothetical protein